MSFEKKQLPTEHPMYLFSSPVHTDGEVAIKEEVEAYVINEVDHTEAIQVKGRTLPISASVDLPDAVCEGFTFKQRVVHCQQECFLLARWKPDRYMRRAASGTSQRWFVDKQLFPDDPGSFLSALAEIS